MGNSLKQIQFTDVSVKGKFIKVPSIVMNGLTIIVQGRWLKKALIKGEDWIEIKDDIDPELLIRAIRENKLYADLLVFSQQIPDSAPKHTYYYEWKNLAVIPITSFDDWWNRLPQVTRKNVRRAGRRGVLVRIAAFNDSLIKDIIRVNNSSPTRQGRKFIHYGKNFDQVKKDYSAYIERSEYIGAYYQEELIGFIRLIYRGQVASIMQLLCMPKHYDKRPSNALIAKAVELCANKGIKYLIYGQLIYDQNFWAPMVEFKKRNGFQKIDVPVYYIPLSFKGRMAIIFRLHRGIKYFIPNRIKKSYYWLRKSFYEIIGKRFHKGEVF